MSIIHWVLIASIALAGIVATRAYYLESDRHWQAYVFKPLATLLVLALALSFPAAPAAYRWAVVGGLVFSTAGDIFLMLPRDRFIAGLVSFLVAHLFYIFAFSSDVPFGAAPLLWLPFFAAGSVVVALIWRGLAPRLRAAVIAYVAVIAVMSGQAAGRWHSLGGEAALSAAVGAALFVVSDSALAINRFRAQFHAERALTLGTYWTAQTLIALSLSASPYSA
ncbi:MAG: lysoplasmalogenase [Betaproteobacteria bacterium]|nr:MAG: lysoplasmalogenase [Betaproteobacteria bacterium]